MVALVDVISIAVATSPPVRISHHWPGGPGDSPCTADPPPPTAGSRELTAPSSARASSACPSLSQPSLEAPPPQPPLATVSGQAPQAPRAPPPLLSTQPPAPTSQDAARGREVWSRGTLRPPGASGTWRLPDSGRAGSGMAGASSHTFPWPSRGRAAELGWPPLVPSLRNKGMETSLLGPMAVILWNDD
ncbi:uncharacterized protein LOC113597710 [Acinonyx jubatus]|uniref:Uncharacterized protein LOC113597710 n=1 Tax=Acinonyx jubatus TaxID=32536 RepID=A0A6J1YZX8_ACIJB|nr:uncharacterized protein LOC113597710 [Acinonyx jubatus]